MTVTIVVGTVLLIIIVLCLANSIGEGRKPHCKYCHKEGHWFNECPMIRTGGNVKW
jgi:hypothetical protein